MTTNTIIQLARFNSTNKPSNAEWTNSIREPVIINQGDTLSVRQAFVDSRLNSSTNIVIAEDTTLSLTYYFYMMYPADSNSWQNDDVEVDSSYYEFTQGGTQIGNWTWKYTGTDYVAFAAPNGWTNAAGAPVPPQTPSSAAPLLRRLQKPLNTFEVARGQPVAPQSDTDGTAEGQVQWSVPINQCQAVEVPMLLITNDIGDGDPYENTPITKTWSYVLKAGSYSPANLADILTKNMAEIQTNKTTPSYNPTQLFGGNTPSNLNNFLIKGTIVSVEELGAPDSVNRNIPDVLIGTARYNDLHVEQGDMLFSSNSPAFAASPQHKGVFSNFLTDTPFNTNYFDEHFYFYYGDYSLANAANVARQFTNPIMFMPSHYAGTIINAWGQSEPNDPVVPNIARSIRTYNSSVVGASEISLEYNPETEVFQFTYLHTPLEEQPLTAGTSSAQASEPVEVVKIIKSVNVNIYGKTTDAEKSKADGEVKICEQTRHSGVFFQSMEPAGFWQDIMGFDVPNITFPANEVWGPTRTMTFEQFNKVTTSGYVGIENNFNTTMTATSGSTSTIVVPNKNNPAYLAPFPTQPAAKNFVYTYTELLNSDEWILEDYTLKNDVLAYGYDNPPNLNQIYYNYGVLAGANSDFYEEYSSALNATNPLQAIQIPLSQTNGSGHYFVEVVGYNNNVNDFINDNSIYAIKSIVAAYYVSPNSFITQPFADTALYEHIGDTQHINKFRVRLLDPLTMKVAAPLGPNSSVYLQLGKQITKIALEQPM